MRLHFELAGEGEPIVLLHGFTGAGTDWIPLLEHLPPCRYLMPDLRGHGRSPNPTNMYTHGQSAKDVYKLLDSLGIERFSACGMSGGAMALLHMATQQPERLEAMVLVSATTHYPDQARRLMALEDAETKTPEEWQSMRSKHPGGDEQIRELWRLARAFKDDPDDMSFKAADLERIEASTLLVHGDSDPLFPLPIAEDLHRHIRDSELWVIPGGGHVPVFGDQMAEFFARASAHLDR